jgi:hypothetical protein
MLIRLKPWGFIGLIFRVKVTSTLKMEAESFFETLTTIFLRWHIPENHNFNLIHYPVWHHNKIWLANTCLIIINGRTLKCHTPGQPGFSSLSETETQPMGRGSFLKLSYPIRMWVDWSVPIRGRGASNSIYVAEYNRTNKTQPTCHFHADCKCVT